MSDLNIITFTAQGNGVPISLDYVSSQVPNLPSGSNALHTTYQVYSQTAIPIHEAISGFNDSIYVMLHSISEFPIMVQVFQSDGVSAPVLFKCLQVNKFGNHQNILFNGHTMFSNQKLYIVLDNESDKDKIFVTGYVKRFAI